MRRSRGKREDKSNTENAIRNTRSSTYLLVAAVWSNLLYVKIQYADFRHSKACRWELERCYAGCHTIDGEPNNRTRSQCRGVAGDVFASSC